MGLSQCKIRERLSRIDSCIVDLDNCMYRGVSIVTVAQHVARRLWRDPLRQADRRFLPRIYLAGLVLACMRLWQKLSERLQDGDLVVVYADLLHQIPSDYFRDAAQSIPSGLAPGVVPAFAWLARRWPIGVISLGLSEVLDRLDEYLREFTGYGFAFKCGNDLQRIRHRAGCPILTSQDKAN